MNYRKPCLDLSCAHSAGVRICVASGFHIHADPDVGIRDSFIFSDAFFAILAQISEILPAMERVMRSLRFR